MAKTKGEPLAKVKVAGRAMGRELPEPRLSEALGSRLRRGLAIFNPTSGKIRRRTPRPPPPDSRPLLLRQAIIQKKSVENGFAFFEELLGAKSFENVAHISSEYAKTSYVSFAAYLTKIGELHTHFVQSFGELPLVA
jgi:Phasin protein